MANFGLPRWLLCLHTWKPQRNEVLPSTLPPKVSIPTAKDFRSGETDLERKQEQRVEEQRNVATAMLWTPAHAPLQECCASPSIAHSNPDWKHSAKLKRRCRVSFCRKSLIEISGRVYRNPSWTKEKQVVNSVGRWCTGTLKWTDQNKTVHAHKLSSKQIPAFMGPALCSDDQREQGCEVLVRLNTPLPLAFYREAVNVSDLAIKAPHSYQWKAACVHQVSWKDWQKPEGSTELA